MDTDKNIVFKKISAVLKQLILKSDMTIFFLYDMANGADGDPVQTLMGDKSMGFDGVPNQFNFDGIGVWYLVERNKDVYKAVKILTYIEEGQFINGQVGDFEGYWEEFSHYIEEDKWVAHMINKEIANDRGMEDNRFRFGRN